MFYVKTFLTILICYFLVACTSLIFKPVKEYDELPEKLSAELQDFYFTSHDDKRLHGWYLPSTINPSKPEKTILYLHGTTKNMSRNIAHVSWLPELGYEIYMFDYRGYGKSEGRAYLDGVMMDIDAAINYVADKQGSNTKFTIIGHSLGASMGIYAVSQSERKNQIESFIALAAFSDYRKVTRDFLDKYWFAWLFQWPMSLTINNDYRPLDFVAKLSPVSSVFIHGEDDEVIGFHHSMALYEAAQQPKVISIIESNHNEMFENDENREVLLRYLGNEVQ